LENKDRRDALTGAQDGPVDRRHAFERTANHIVGSSPCVHLGNGTAAALEVRHERFR
jgi:hypothetical protein